MRKLVAGLAITAAALTPTAALAQENPTDPNDVEAIDNPVDDNDDSGFDDWGLLGLAGLLGLLGLAGRRRTETYRPTETTSSRSY